MLLAWMALLVLEHLAVGIGQRALFSGSWEMSKARSLVTPIAVAALAPVALMTAALAHVASRASRDARARVGVAVLAGAAGGVVAYGVSFGRHMERWSVRAPFIALVVAVSFGVAWAVAPRLARASSNPAGRARLAAAGACGALLMWCADVTVLPRLYPAFHAALFGLTLASAAFVPLAWYASHRERAVAFAALAVAVAAAGWTPFAARRLASADNLRLVLTEHAPLMGRAVRIASWIAPPVLDDGRSATQPGQQLDEAPPDGTRRPLGAGEIARSLDWSGNDVLLLSVDALRADHLSSYGYARRTTPAIDALAREGALFENAYCPTPHTSYSVTSMLTGKAMRPLLSLGLGKESETWAAYLRRYGYRTAAFYPPAVFFIDEERFRRFESSGLDFEYQKVEFASASERVEQVRAYLDASLAADGRSRAPLFLWVHLFEPHEPYVMHADHAFGPETATDATPMDAYDSEIAAADAGVGAIVTLVRARRPSVAIFVTADHGEEFGEHGGRYHGTSCYEEQVHVPLIVLGPGVAAQRVATVVQTIDLLPTALSALGIPRPARVRGRDLGPLMAAHGAEADGRPAAQPGQHLEVHEEDPGLAYAETDEYTLLARGKDRLVCARKIGACTLYDVANDPRESHDLGGEAPELAKELRRETAAVEKDQGRLEVAFAAAWPDALRRGLQGDVDAAEDVATLLDDASVVIRRKAAEVLFRLHAESGAAAVKRALDRDEDDEVRRWCALALVRIDALSPAPPLAEALVHDASVAWRRPAALAFAERGDARGAGELAAWWGAEAPPREGLDVEAGKELLRAIARTRDAAAVPLLLESFAFVPLRPWIADALGAIGDARAKAPLVLALASERYVTARSHEARALLLLGARDELFAPLARFAGIPEPMEDVVSMARDAKVLDARRGGIALDAPAPALHAVVRVPMGAHLRLLALAAAPGGALHGTASAEPLAQDHPLGAMHVVELEPARGEALELDLSDPAGLIAAWVVARASDIEPAPPVRADVGADGGRPPRDN